MPKAPQNQFLGIWHERRSIESHEAIPIRRPPLKELKRECSEELAKQLVWIKEGALPPEQGTGELRRLETIYARFWKDLKARYGDALELYAENAIVDAVRPIYLGTKERVIESIRNGNKHTGERLRLHFVVQYAVPITGSRTGSIESFKHLLGLSKAKVYQEGITKCLALAK